MADKITVGNVEITAVMDMVPPPRPPEQMLPEGSREDWGPYDDFPENGQTQPYYGVWVVRSQGQTILVDTGMGPGPHEHLDNRTGNLYEELLMRAWSHARVHQDCFALGADDPNPVVKLNLAVFQDILVGAPGVTGDFGKHLLRRPRWRV